MRIIGVDPRSTTTGYAVIEVKGDHIHVLTMGIIRLSKYPDHQRKLREIFLRVQTVIEQYGLQYMTIEDTFFGKNSQSMLNLGRVLGVSFASSLLMELYIAVFTTK